MAKVKVRRPQAAANGRPPAKIKVKKPGPPAEPSGRTQQQELPFHESPGKHIQSVARAYRLGFGSLGGEKKLKDEEADKLLKNVKVERHRLKLAKKLYDLKHPLISAVSSKRGAVEAYWKARTLPYPAEAGVRLFPVKGETEEEQAVEIRDFLEEMNKLMDAYRSAVAELVKGWQSVLDQAERELIEFWDPEAVLTAREVEVRMYVDFRPFNFELPEYLKKTAPAEYRRQVARLEAEFKAAADKQAAVVTKMIADAVDQMVASVQGYHDGEKKCFHDQTITRVLDALDEFRDKTKRFGIMDGSELEREFGRLARLMRSGGAALPKDLRNNDLAREDFLGKATSIRDAILSFAQPERRRAVIRPEAPASTPA